MNKYCTWDLYVDKYCTYIKIIAEMMLDYRNDSCHRHPTSWYICEHFILIVASMVTGLVKGVHSTGCTDHQN